MTLRTQTKTPALFRQPHWAETYSSPSSNTTQTSDETGEAQQQNSVTGGVYHSGTDGERGSYRYDSTLTQGADEYNTTASTPPESLDYGWDQTLTQTGTAPGDAIDTQAETDWENISPERGLETWSGGTQTRSYTLDPLSPPLDSAAPLLSAPLERDPYDAQYGQQSYPSIVRDWGWGGWYWQDLSYAPLADLDLQTPAETR